MKPFGKLGSGESAFRAGVTQLPESVAQGFSSLLKVSTHRAIVTVALWLSFP